MDDRDHMSCVHQCQIGQAKIGITNGFIVLVTETVHSRCKDERQLCRFLLCCFIADVTHSFKSDPRQPGFILDSDADQKILVLQEAMLSLPYEAGYRSSCLVADDVIDDVRFFLRKHPFAIQSFFQRRACETI